jgi:hypothetical protein
MTTKFTPGPWYSKDSRNIFAANGLHIASTTGGLPHGPIETRANAKLIAAATDLLEALQNALGVCQAYATQSIAARQCAEMAEKAIAKALGEQE